MAAVWRDRPCPTYTQARRIPLICPKCQTAFPAGQSNCPSCGAASDDLPDDALDAGDVPVELLRTPGHRAAGSHQVSARILRNSLHGYRRRRLAHFPSQHGGGLFQSFRPGGHDTSAAAGFGSSQAIAGGKRCAARRRLRTVGSGVPPEPAISPHRPSGLPILP